VAGYSEVVPENETHPRELISAIRVFLKLSVDSLTSCFSAAHFPP